MDSYNSLCCLYTVDKAESCVDLCRKVNVDGTR